MLAQKEKQRNEASAGPGTIGSGSSRSSNSPGSGSNSHKSGEISSGATKRRRTESPENGQISTPVVDDAPRLQDSEILSQGAEAILTKVNFLGREAVRKDRLQKHYRHPELDKRLRSRRLNQEVRVLLRLRKAGVAVPALYDVDIRRYTFMMQLIHGVTLKAFLQSVTAVDGAVKSDVDELAVSALKIAGNSVARMHAADIVHGDLTTGNIMVHIKGSKNVQESHQSRSDGHDIHIYLIDFGLSYGNGSDEDFAVDLYVFERAVIAAHSEHAQELNNAFLSSYAAQLGRQSVLARLEDVRARGRKRDMTG